MSDAEAPADHDVRQRVIHELDTSFFLEAGAGTGKTSVLVARVVEMARRGFRLNRLVAITFTEKAASELRERIRAELTRAGLADAVRDLEGAQISTVHAFASMLLRERALDAGLDPNFRVLDQLQIDLRFQQSWRGWLWSDASAPVQAAIQRALALGLELSDLQAMAEHMTRNRDLAPAAASHESIDLDAELGRMKQDAEALVAACQRQAPVNTSAAERILDDVRRCHTAPPSQIGPHLLAIDFRGSPAGRDPERAAIRESWFALRDRRDELIRQVRDRTLSEITGALHQFVLEDAQRRRREGVLSYDDLLLEARNLLVRRPAARRSLRARFDSILVDEFQDTDPLQAEIVLLLAAREDTSDWREAEPGPGRLTLVGDPKQSIYRFRRADIDTYEEVRELFRRSRETAPGTAAIERLSVNFRARPALASWQNGGLSNLLKSDSAYPRAQAEFQPIVPERSDPGGGVVTVVSRSEYPRVGEARKDEGELTARLIAHLVEGRSELGRISDDGASRAPALREIAILIRTRTGISSYTDALNRAGIPYHFDSGQGYYQRPEIRAAAHLLQAIDDPTDAVAALAVLKSPLVAASDQELFEYVHTDAGSRITLVLDPDAIPHNYDGRLRDRIAELAQLRDSVRDLPLPQLVERVVRRSGLLEAQLLSGAESTERQANLQMLIQRASDFASAESDSLRPFVRWLSQRQGRNLPESESPTSEADDDVVRILTIHQAKGLEFPVVILPKLFDRPGGTSKFIVDRPNRRVAYRLGRDRQFATPGIAAAEQRDEAYAEAEARRMLYVACTRARDWLILPSFRPQTMSSDGAFHGFLEQADPGWLTRTGDPVIRVLAPDQFDALRARPREETLVAHAELRQQWDRLHAEALAHGDPRTTAQTPSGLAGDLAKHEREAPIDEDHPGPDTADLSLPDPLLFGSAIHAALEVADLHDPARTERRVRSICIKNNLPADAVLAQVERTLASPLFERVRKAQEVHRELPLTTVQPDDTGATIITEGVADLLFREPDGWVLVDYKSDREIPPDRLAGYQTQIQTYAHMLQTMDIAPSEAWLLQTATGASIRIPLP